MTFKIIISTTLLLIVLSCRENTSKKFKYPDIKDIDEITTVLLLHDTLPIYRRPNIPYTTIRQDGRKLIHYPIVMPICIELRKIKIIFPDTSTTSELPSLDAVGFDYLYNIKIGGKKIFNSKDSLSFLTQNEVRASFQLPTKLRDTLQLTNIEKEKKKADKQDYPPGFYDISLPIFSADLKTAYVELRNMSEVATGYILQKVNGHWQIKTSFRIWIS